MRTAISRKPVLSCICSGVMIVPLIVWVFASAQTHRPSLYSIDSYGIHKRGPDRGDPRTVFNTSGMYKVKFTLSPSDTTIAVVITEAGYTPPGEHGYTVLPKNSMVFIDTAGREIARLDEDVRRYSWSPDGQEIAYIAGTYYEGGVGFKVTEVGIFDLRDKSRTPIEKDFAYPSAGDYQGGGYEINWALHDSNVYIEDFDYVGGPYRYNPKTGKTEQVPYPSVDFSPDGRYFRVPLSVGNDSLRVYRTADNEEVLDRFWERFRAPQRKYGLDWVFDRGHLAHVVVYEYDFATEEGGRARKPSRHEAIYNVLYDLEKDEIVRELELPVSRWTAGRDKLVLEKDGRFVVLTYEDVCEQK